MSNLPQFITFTGADDKTSVDGMIELSALYPIEWGILFSPKRHGQGRYPSVDFLTKLAQHSNSLNLSAHLCGGYSRNVINAGVCGLEEPLSAHFERAQINTTERVDLYAIAGWADAVGLNVILQTRDEVAFPADEIVSWLYDCSGGRGVLPDKWPFEALPPAPGTPPRLVGFAGGLGPDNVAEAVKTIGADTLNYWIDMESRVRNDKDEFDLALCRKVCEAVYGARQN